MSIKEYYEFIISVPDESREAVMNKLTDMGSSGFFEREANIVAYFEYRPDIKGLCDELESFRNVLKASGLNSAFSFDYTLIPPTDWNETWKKNFKPIDLGQNLTIVPSWIKPSTNRVPIIIDPAMAFGTGYHETTQRCLVCIEKLSADSKGKNFLDIGTGTGILAIGAARLGFTHVTAVDIDQEAVDAAHHNAGLNNLNTIQIIKGSITDVKETFDVVAANLLSDILIDSANAIAATLNPGGTAILSGMLTGQETGVVKAMEDAGLIFNEAVEDGKWVTVVLDKLEN